MGLNHSPNIVRSGLVLYLDAANVKSYSGSGTTWTDLSGNARNASLFNSPTFNSSNNGYLAFDGTNDYATCASGNQWALGSSFSLEMWAYATGSIASNHRMWCTNNNISSLDAGIGIEQSIYGKFFMHGGDVYTVSSFPYNAWVLITAVYNSGNLTLKFNNVVQSLTGKVTGYNITNNNTLFIGQFAGGGNYYFNGRIPSFRIYNRALSDSEVSQNFNATRSRYGL